MADLSSRAEKETWLAGLHLRTKEGCIDWPWSLDSSGYGVLWDNARGQMVRVMHRVLVQSGRPRPAPPSHHALHSCPERRRQCVAPWHLRWGTNAENGADSYREGRRPPMAKLTPGEVATIRTAYAAGGITQSALADQHGVTAKTIHRVITRATWRTT